VVADLALTEGKIMKRINTLELDHDSVEPTILVYRRLQEALDGGDIAYAISRLSDRMARDFCADTGVKIGVAYPLT
tara:strand:- start:359 stop:586 length:228 start_codon:yes stop_codon:yes gene_type:complete